MVHGAGRQGRLTEPRRILGLWVKGYETLVRPRLLIGRYRAQETDPEALERLIEAKLGAEPQALGRTVEGRLDERVVWAFGGAAAAYRLTGYYRGPDTVVHVQQPGFDIAQALRALPDDDGPLILLRVPGPIAFEGAAPRTVAPLLVYTELLFVGDKRALEAAAEVQRMYLKETL
jgi:hypothetical protein